jgi:hypothetical protein
MGASVSDDGRPMLYTHDANQQITRFVICFCRNFQQHRVVSERLRLNEIDAMLGAIGISLCGVKLKVYNGIENIP